MVSRRAFLKRASGLVAAVAAPLFIPSERLDFGVPRQRIVVSEPVEMLKIIGGEVTSFDRLYRRFLELPPQPVPMDDWDGAKRFVRVEFYPSHSRARLQQSPDGMTWADVLPGDNLKRGHALRTLTTMLPSDPLRMSFSVRAMKG